MFPNINPTSTDAWRKLAAHQKEMSKKNIIDLFNDAERVKKYAHEFESCYIDFSKHYIDEETIGLFRELVKETSLSTAMKALRAGEPINDTEKRAVLHTALRNMSGREYKVNGDNVVDSVNRVLGKIKAFTEALHSGEWRGYTGKKITSIVNIGIGGSDLGPYMVCQALKPYAIADIQTRFVSNVDASDMVEKLEGLDPETTLFIIASKTFTTQETMTNAATAKDWFLNRAKDTAHVKKHFVAVSTHEAKVTAFGIDKANMFEFWDWVGGRYSLWSAIGLSIACTLGYRGFEELLRGAEAMDNHFFETEDVRENIPMMMALLGVWYNNFFGAETHAILPYDHLLSAFSRYLQQADMESNGKCVDRTGRKLNYQSGQIIWGEPGTNGQHAFFQLIHQGTKLIPCDFIASANAPHGHDDHQDKLIANFIAQTEALMIGKSERQVREELTDAGKNEEEIQRLLPFKVFEGNRPTTTILMEKLNPRALGTLIAMYEHKIFVQGVIWNVYSFDQWGVELGKQLAGKILSEIKGAEGKHDRSTSKLIKKYVGVANIWFSF